MRGAFIILCLILIGLGFSAQSQENETTSDSRKVATWRFAHLLPANHVLAQVFADWASEVEAASNGALEIEFYPSSQLGSARDHYDLVRFGIADVSWAIPGYQPGRFPIFSVMEIPFMTNNSGVAAGVFHKWYLPHAATEMSEIHYCLTTISPPNRLHFQDRKVVRPEDLSGLRMRTPNATVGRYVRDVGGVAINIPLSETRQAFERNLIDAMPFAYKDVLALGLEPVVNSHLDFSFAVSPALIAINKDSYNSLPDEVRLVVDQHCTAEWSRRMMSDWEVAVSDGRSGLEAAGGHDIYQIDQADFASWREARAGVLENWLRFAARRGLAEPSVAFTQLETALQVADRIHAARGDNEVD